MRLLDPVFKFNFNFALNFNYINVQFTRRLAQHDCHIKCHHQIVNAQYWNSILSTISAAMILTS